MQFQSLHYHSKRFAGAAAKELSRKYPGVGNTTICNLLRSQGIHPAIRPDHLPPHLQARIRRVLDQKVSPLVMDYPEQDFVAKITAGHVGALRTARGYPSRDQLARRNA
eukprot:RCo008765